MNEIFQIDGVVKLRFRADAYERELFGIVVFREGASLERTAGALRSSCFVVLLLVCLFFGRGVVVGSSLDDLFGASDSAPCVAFNAIRDAK